MLENLPNARERFLHRNRLHLATSRLLEPPLDFLQPSFFGTGVALPEPIPQLSKEKQHLVHRPSSSQIDNMFHGHRRCVGDRPVIFPRN